MTKRYPGGYITKTAPTVTTSSAPGIWTMEQQAAYQKAGTWPAQPNPQYIEDVFSTWLYTGNSSTQTITNGIDLAGKGGMLWVKGRSNAYNHFLFDTAQGIGGAGTTYYTSSNTTGAAGNLTDLLYANSNGFAWGANVGAQLNNNGSTFASWTFRKQPKFFDVVTYTGTGSLRTVSHNLGSVPGCIIIKRTDSADDWFVQHRSVTSGSNVGYLLLDATNAAAYDYTVWNNTLPTSTAFTVNTASGVNASGGTYVAYLFAHNAGGFGAAGTDNVISCGSFTTNGSGNLASPVDLGYEPQWIMMKDTSSNAYSNWIMFDTMRGWVVSNTDSPALLANESSAQTPFTNIGGPTATGFNISGGSLSANKTYIYIAIRRGPMKTPTSGTSVFKPISSSSSTGTTQTTDFPVDMQWLRSRDADATYVIDRLRGISTTPITASSRTLYTNDTFAESGTNTSNGWNNTGFSIPSQQGGTSSIYWSFKRAPGFFDEVCYTGTGVARTVNHNLGVAPELMIVKGRSVAEAWVVYSATLGPTKYLRLNATSASASDGGVLWNNTSPTSSVFSLGDGSGVNVSGGTYVAYLFASVAGVSKVGSYSGTGASQVINCGFTGGARFVIIKRTDSTGDWYTYDTARGMTSSTDPYLLLNSTAAETTGTDYVETSSTGFTITSTAPAAINANGGTFIFLAIA